MLSTVFVLLQFFLPKANSATFVANALMANGFTCTTEAGGDICQVPQIASANFQYSQPVVLLIPSNIQTISRFVLYLHGFRGVCESANATPTQMVDEFGFLKQMSFAEAQNTIMVFPISTGQCTTFENELAPHFQDFLGWLHSQIQFNSERWIIAGHSGSYLPIGSILEAQAKQNPAFIKQVDAAILLDATYTTSQPYFQQWQDAANINPAFSVYTVYRDGGGTEAGSEMLKSSLPKNSVEIIESETNDHCQVPNYYFGRLLWEVGSPQ